MFPQFATRSQGRISAPRQAQPRRSAATAQPSSAASEALRPRRGGSIAAAPACIAMSGSGLLLQLGELRVDLDDPGLLLVGRHRAVVLELGFLAEELELPDRDQLGVRRFPEGCP